MDEYCRDAIESALDGSGFEYLRLREVGDALGAFELFVKRNVSPSTQRQFTAGSNIDAELFRRVIRRRNIPPMPPAAWYDEPRNEQGR